MKKWMVVGISIYLLLAFDFAAADELLALAPREESIPWGAVILAGMGMSVTAWFFWRNRRRRIGRELPSGDYVLAVKGAPGVRYTVCFDDETEVIWRSADNVDGDPWYASAHRSSGEPAGLDVILYDEDGVPVREWFYLASWVRDDRALDTIMATAGRYPDALNFRILLDIGESTVRLVVFPGSDLPPQSDDWAADSTFHKGGTTVWLGQRDPSGNWVEKRKAV